MDRDLSLELSPDGRYCDVQTELRVATAAADAQVAVRWHLEVRYFGDQRVREVTPPTVSVEPLP